ncbi:MAG: hypothetical protein JHD28_01640 [Bacteroidia bacterium]|nr:hypothetical protein [Bacteroidia bacterium]
MKTILRNVLAVIVGILVGSVVNMALINLSSFIIPPPLGVDVTTEEGLKAGIHLFEPKHFIMPFLAHALGTFVGALLTVLIAANNKMKLALTIGMVFFIGGAMMVYMLPGPIWFAVVDLVFAYIPMGLLAVKIASKKEI